MQIAQRLMIFRQAMKRMSGSMSALREFTEAEKEWLKENYSKMSQKDCATYLHCTNNTVRTLAKKLGIYVNKHPLRVEDKKEVVVIPAYLNSGENFCLDCAYYLVGGNCGKTGRITGALHKKSCFKRNEDE